MCRFEVTREDDRLTLNMPLADRMLTVGAILLLCSFSCVALLGLLGFVWEAASGTEHSGLEPAQFFSPHGNHFGFLWLIGMVVLFALIPIYAARAYRAAVTFVFDRPSSRLTRNGRTVAHLARIESVRIRKTADPDDVPLHTLLIVHGDGMEFVLHTSYDEEEIAGLAREIAEFVGLATVTRRGSSIVHRLMPADDGR